MSDALTHQPTATGTDEWITALDAGAALYPHAL